MKVSTLSIASVGVIVALHAAPTNAQQVRRKIKSYELPDGQVITIGSSAPEPGSATKSAKRGTSSPTSDTLTSAKSAKAASFFAKSAKASVSTSSPTSDTLGGSKSSKGGVGKSSSDDLSWLAGEWWLCEERQTRLVRNDIPFDRTTSCSDIYGFKITSLTDDNTDDNTNFILEHGGFNASCIAFGIPSDVTCDVNGKIQINQVFVGTLSLNKKWQDSITFVGKRVEYLDPGTGKYVPVSEFVDGYFTTLKVDLTDSSHLYVDWASSIRRYNKNGPAFDIISSRSWKLVKDLEKSCDTCPSKSQSLTPS